MEIRVFHTHIEVYPYHMGDNFNFEKSLSKWVEKTSKYGCYEPVGFYVENDILYLPRGINLSQLASLFRATPTMMHSCDYNEKIQKANCTCVPRDKTQELTLDFLLCKNDFTKGNLYSQFGLNLDTGDGKTCCMVMGIMQMKYKAIIITHKTRIKEQWMDTFRQFTDVDEERLCDIDGSDTIKQIMTDKKEADFYFVNHQTLQSYARDNGWIAVRNLFQKLKVGVKVIDEAHKFFRNTLMIDFFSDVHKTFYLTATFTRSDPREVSIYKKAFASVYKFGEDIEKYVEKRRHIVFIAMFYQSKPVYGEAPSVSTLKGFSSYKYIDYELKQEPKRTLLRVLNKALNSVSKLRGRTLILSPKIETVDMIADYVKDRTDKSVGTIHSKNKQAENEENFTKDIISSTIGSIGEGDNVKGLRNVICLEPIGSKSLLSQVVGRLREFSKEDDTFFIYPIDMTLKEPYELYKRTKSVLKHKCKEIIEMKVYDV